jgi:hypothetical protein
MVSRLPEAGFIGDLESARSEIKASIKNMRSVVASIGFLDNTGVYILAGELGAWRADHLLALRRYDARFKWSPAIAGVARLTTRAKAILVTPHAPSSMTPVYAPSEC